MAYHCSCVSGSKMAFYCSINVMLFRGMMLLNVESISALKTIISADQALAPDLGGGGGILIGWTSYKICVVFYMNLTLSNGTGRR
jgi:hypothetical protein